MATLTKSTGTVTLSGTAEKVTLPAAYGWVWVKNMSDSDMFAGLSADISEGADGVMVIPSGECGRIQTDGFNSIYLVGTGNALVVAQNYADCPFKLGAKGGEIPDLSVYAKKTDVPNIKVNSAVDADTVNGHSVNADVPENAVFTDTVPDLSPYAKKTDIPTELPANGGNADTLDGLHANEIASNPNLLINPDFRVNQQGKSEYIGTTECWDKWTVHAGWYTVRSSNDDAAIFTCRTPQVNAWVVSQNIPNYKDYIGKTVTFSAYVITGSTKFNLLINDGVDQVVTPMTTGRISVTYTVPNSATALSCVIATNGQEDENEQIGVFSTKLELGTIATTFVPPNPSIEIAKVRAANNYKPYVTGTLSEQASDLPVTMSFTIFDFTPSKVICQFGNGNAFFANVVTNGFSLTIPAGTTTIHYIAFK